MAASPNSDKPKRRRRDRGDDGIWWDRANHHYVGAVSLGFDSDGKRNRPTVRGRTRAEVKEKLDKLHDELNAGIHTPATYTVEQCVKDWFASIERDEHTMQTLTGQARKWIYPRIGATKLKDFSATDAVKFFQQIAPFLSKRTLVMIKSTLRRSIRRAQVHDLIGRNVIELIDLPAGKPGRPSRAMTQDQAAKVLKTANGGPTGYVKVVKASSGPVRRNPRRHRVRPARLRHQVALEGADHRGEPRAQGRHLPLLPHAARPRRHRQCQPAPGRPLRPFDHPRPAPRRTPDAHLGLRGP